MRRFCLIAFGALALLGCDVTGRRVLMVGDSNMALSADVYVDYLYGGKMGSVQPIPSFLLTFAAVPGARFSHSAMWAGALGSVFANAEFDAVVINLGGNDALAGQCTTGLAAHIDTVLGAVPSGLPVILANVPHFANAAYSWPCINAVNADLAAVPSRWPNVIPFSATGNVEALPDNQRWLADGAHFSYASKMAMASALNVVLEGAL